MRAISIGETSTCQGKQMFSQEELVNCLQDIADKMYKGDPDNPYVSEKDGEVVEMSCAEVGVTTAMVTELCRSLECSHPQRLE